MCALGVEKAAISLLSPEAVEEVCAVALAGFHRYACLTLELQRCPVPSGIPDRSGEMRRAPFGNLYLCG